MTRILIVEDQNVVQSYLQSIVNENENYSLVGTIDNASLSDMYCDTCRVDLILMDVCTADNQSGLKFAKKIKEKHPNIKIIIITSMPEVSFIDKAKKAGCESFCYKAISKDELKKVIQDTINGKSVYPLSKPSVTIGNAKSIEFTKKELTILRELIEGNNQNEIAEKYGITRTAVKYHISNMLQKTG